MAERWSKQEDATLLKLKSNNYSWRTDFGQQFNALPDPQLQILIFDPHQHHIEAVQSFEAAKSLLGS